MSPKTKKAPRSGKTRVDGEQMRIIILGWFGLEKSRQQFTCQADVFYVNKWKTI
jgi:hypothetical protein